METNNNTKQGLIKKEEDNMVQLMDQSGIETAIEKIVSKNNSLIPNNVAIEKIKNSAGFYIANRDDLMKLEKKAKLEMLYGVLKEAMVGCEAGVDYDIVPFKGKPVITRKKEGWYKIIDMIKPAEIVRFTVNIILNGEDYSFNPVTEELIHKKDKDSDQYNDIKAAYCYIEFANGFRKTVFMTRKDIDTIKKVSPSASTSFSPWNTMPMKMVKTKCVKEMAKELFTLFSGKVNSVLAQAIENDETVVGSINNHGYIENDNTIYSDDFSPEVIEQDETNVSEDIDTNNKSAQVNLDEI